jgi:hypothetical protein
MLDYLFKENSDIRNQIATIMEYLETTFFEVDLKNKKFNYDYDRKSSFLYLNVLQDLLRVDKKNNRPKFSQFQPQIQKPFALRSDQFGARELGYCYG